MIVEIVWNEPSQAWFMQTDKTIDKQAKMQLGYYLRIFYQSVNLNFDKHHRSWFTEMDLLALILANLYCNGVQILLDGVKFDAI